MWSSNPYFNNNPFVSGPTKLWVQTFIFYILIFYSVTYSTHVGHLCCIYYRLLIVCQLLLSFVVWFRTNYIILLLMHRNIIWHWIGLGINLWRVFCFPKEENKKYLFLHRLSYLKSGLFCLSALHLCSPFGMVDKRKYCHPADG